MLIFLVVNTLIGYNSLKMLEANRKSMANTLDIILLIKDIHLQLVKAETGQRGYIITDDEDYLVPYYRSLGELGRLLVRLYELTSEVPEQNENLLKLYAAASEKMEEVGKTIELKRNDMHKKATDLVNTDLGKNLMTEIYMLVSNMEELENNLLLQRNAEALIQTSKSKQVLFAANIFGVVLLVIIYFWMSKHLRQRQIYADLIQQANDELEQKIDERTRSLQLYSDELQRSNRELQNFAFVASHDLQEPLRKIRAFGARLKQTSSDGVDKQGIDYIDRMVSASERMSLLIDDLLTFSRLVTQKKPFEPLDLNAVLEQVVDDLQVAIEDADADITVQHLPSIEGDRVQIHRLFQNLIANSIKFRAADRPLKIEVYVEAIGDQIVNGLSIEACTIVVKDNGIGFEPRFADKIFTLFQRLHGRDEYGGTGLGLAICRRIAEQHGGSIVAMSEVGRGAEFKVILSLRYTQLISPDGDTCEG